jgi:hypothetical protein
LFLYLFFASTLAVTPTATQGRRFGFKALVFSLFLFLFFSSWLKLLHTVEAYKCCCYQLVISRCYVMVLLLAIVRKRVCHDRQRRSWVVVRWWWCYYENQLAVWEKEENDNTIVLDCVKANRNGWRKRSSEVWCSSRWRNDVCCVLVFFSESEWRLISFYSFLSFFLLKVGENQVYLVIFLESVLVYMCVWCVFGYLYHLSQTFHLLDFFTGFPNLLDFSREFLYLSNFGKKFPSIRQLCFSFFFLL